MSKTAFLFPGQGSQSVGMGEDLYHENTVSRAHFKKADEVLEYDLSGLMFKGPEDELTLTENTQPALLTASTAFLERLSEKGITPDYVAGHSLGEYSALVASGALSFEDAVYAVRKRGEFMEEAVPAGVGAMAAILGMQQDDLETVCEQARNATGKTVQLANINSPSQIVISGSKEAVEKAGELASEAGAKRVIPLNVSGPFHSELMKPAAEKLSEVLDGLTVKDAEIPVIANVTAEEVTAAGDIKNHLIEQLYSPVRWVETIEYLKAQGVETYVEVGPGKVLSGLVKKIHRRSNVYQAGDLESLQKTLDALEGEADA